MPNSVSDLPDDLLASWPSELPTGQWGPFYDQLAAWLDEIFQQFETWLSAATAERQALEQQHQQLAAARGTEDQRVATLQAELAQLRAELETTGEQTQQVQSEALARQQAVEALSEQNTALAAEAEQRRQEAAALREQLQMQQDEAASQQDEFRTLATQNASLEVELENVRARAAEMSEAVAQAKHQLAEQRDQWSVELKEMRQLLQRQSELLASRAMTPAGGSPAKESEPAANPQPAIVGSVRQQFEKIRADYAAHRAARASGGG